MLDAMRWSGVSLFNWSQMPNHFHLNLTTPDGNLAEFMQRMLSRYAKQFNRIHRMVGHVFQGRYGARLIDQETHFQEIIRYVELNPYRLKKGKLAELGQWKWSSLRYYLHKTEQEWPEGCRAAFKEVLARFGNDVETGRRNLAKFLADGLKEGNWEDFYQVKDRRFVGNEGFIEQAKQLNEEPIRSKGRELIEKASLEDLLETARRVSGLAADLQALGKAHKVSRWRQVLVYVARRFYRIPLVQIANKLNRSESTVSLMWGRHRNEIGEWPETRQLLDALERKEMVQVPEMQNANTGT
jgi:REP element-mobilizing transposase RayT